MRSQNPVVVNVHKKNDPADVFYEHTLSSFEVSILKALLGIPFPGMPITEVVRAAREENKLLDTHRAYSPIQALIKKNLVKVVRKYISLPAPSNTTTNRHIFHYCATVDSVVEVTCEPQNA